MASGPRYIIFNKPYGVLSQFTGEKGQNTLTSYSLPEEVYAAGRLDKDSEGLLFLTNDGPLIKRFLDPGQGHPRTYWVQVERVPSAESLNMLETGVVIKGYKTRPCKVKMVDDDSLNIPERETPIRFRKNIPTCWLELVLTEGKNRQVRRMTAAIGHPTLRLIRVALGKYHLESLLPGEWIEISKEQII